MSISLLKTSVGRAATGTLGRSAGKFVTRGVETLAHAAMPTTAYASSSHALTGGMDLVKQALSGQSVASKQRVAGQLMSLTIAAGAGESLAGRMTNDVFAAHGYPQGSSDSSEPPAPFHPPKLPTAWS